MKFLHVGFKVADIENSMKTYRDLFGITWEPVREYALTTQSESGPTPTRTLVTHGKTDSGFEFEMIQLLDGTTPDDLVLEGRQGLSHVAFTVDDLAAAARRVEQGGLRKVNEFHSERVDFAFFADARLGGALVQLVQFHGPRGA